MNKGGMLKGEEIALTIPPLIDIEKYNSIQVEINYECLLSRETYQFMLF